MSVSRQLGVASKVPGHGPSNLESKEWPSARGADPCSLRRRGSDAQHPLGVWVPTGPGGPNNGRSFEDKGIYFSNCDWLGSTRFLSFCMGRYR